METNIKCKICRRAGAKLLLKGSRCYGQKCAMVRRPTAPGKKGKRRARSLSEFGRELREKQRVKAWYNLREQQFKNYVKAVLAKKGSAEDLPLALMGALEGRLDNVVFRLGFAPSRLAARQLVSHKSFLVNGKPVNLPSYRVIKGDVVSVAPRKIKNAYFVQLQPALKSYKTPLWLSLDADKMEGKRVGDISMEELALPAEIGSVFEFYAR
ncbi:MAG: 30S ribosomal protein S4 [Candidatus Nealsonbacteria bacterium DGGOD1a]|nr:MAG: 30S ribosomal protein S4 [Candidatus Nealsonbacteria bacterium DGGOD1a]